MNYQGKTQTKQIIPSNIVPDSFPPAFTKYVFRSPSTSALSLYVLENPDPPCDSIFGSAFSNPKALIIAGSTDLGILKTLRMNWVRLCMDEGKHEILVMKFAV
jgi:hypothetical protein